MQKATFSTDFNSPGIGCQSFYPWSIRIERWLSTLYLPLLYKSGSKKLSDTHEQFLCGMTPDTSCAYMRGTRNGGVEVWGWWGDSTDNIWVSHVQCAVKLDFMQDSNCQSSRPCKDMTNMTNIVDHNDNHHYQDDDPHQLWFVKCISAPAPQVQPSEAGWSCLGGLPLPPQRHNRRHHRQSYNHPQCQSSWLKASGRKYSTDMLYIIQK